MNRTRAINLPPVVLWLAVSFVAVHVTRQFLSQDLDEWVLLAFAFIPARYSEIGAQLPGGEAARFWTPVTYAFLHANYLHLFVNIIWMASFGGALARRFGSVRFLLLSLIAAIAGAGLQYAMHSGDEALVIGASGAVSGMMAGTARFAFSPGGPLAGGGSLAAFSVPAEPLAAVLRNGRAIAFILIWFVVNLIFGLAGGYVSGIGGPIAWEAHVGGFAAGLLVFSLLDPVGRSRDESLA
jgi:membrane associated rhomboid family serine protease